MKCNEIMKVLEQLSPLKYACDWDNVGLMAGNPEAQISKVLVALDCDDAAIEKAVQIGADLIVTHHPLIFGDLKNVRSDELTGKRIIKLIQNNICCYAMHTNFDAKGGMAELAANIIGLENTEVLDVILEGEGFGRVGTFSELLTLRQWAERVKTLFGLPHVIVYGDLDTHPVKIAISPGSGKDYVSCAIQKGAQLLITGDMNHHGGIDAVASGLLIIDAGHYGTEHIFVEFVSNYLKKQFLNSNHIEIVQMDKKLPYVIV